ncbi:MAG TPA: Stf0 family sulfotransferase [Chloroflexota bacterium]|nr:Stf0 family sulfotransferase [Chloroflexota bacterium]
MSEQPRLCYFICCTPRSGSSLLAEALANTGLAGNPDEHTTELLEPWHTGFTVADFRKALQPMLDRGSRDGVFGAKLMWPWLEDLSKKLAFLVPREGASVGEVMAKVFPDPHYIMLTRRDKVRQMISMGRAVWTNVWRSTEAANQQGRVEDLRLDPRAVDHEMRVFRDLEASFERFFFENGIKPFRVVYEQLVDRYEETALEVLDFLGIAHPPSLSFAPRVLERQWDAASDELLRQYYAAKGITPLSEVVQGRDSAN